MKTTRAVRALGARPIFAVALMLTVFAMGNALLAGCGGGGNSGTSSTEQTTPPPAEATPADTSSTMAGGAGDATAGQAVYLERCVLCHGPQGKGDGPGAAALNPKPRNHTDGGYMNAQTNDQLLAVIHDGKGAMPAWKGVLTEQQIKDVLTYVRTLAVPPYPG